MPLPFHFYFRMAEFEFLICSPCCLTPTRIRQQILRLPASTVRTGGQGRHNWSYGCSINKMTPVSWLVHIYGSAVVQINTSCASLRTVLVLCWLHEFVLAIATFVGSKYLHVALTLSATCSALNCPSSAEFRGELAMSSPSVCGFQERIQQAGTGGG